MNIKDVSHTNKSTAFSNWIVKNLKTIGVVVGLLVLGGAGWGIYDYLCEKKEQEAQAELFKADQTYEKITKDSQPKVESDEVFTDKKGKPKPVPVKPETIDYTTAIELYKKVIAANPKSTTAILAAHKLADIYLLKKNYEDSLQVLESVKTNVKQTNILLPLTTLKIAGVLHSMGKCTEAIDKYEILASDKNNPTFKGEALLNKGLCFEELGQSDKARDIYQTLSKEHGDTSAGKQAEKYLRLLNKG